MNASDAVQAVRVEADVETSSDGYARRFSGSVGRWFLEVQSRVTSRILTALPEHSRILDVGGGHGQLVDAVLDGGHQLTIIGSDPRCGHRLTKWTEAGRLKFEIGNLLSLPYPDSTFDAALCFRLMPHVGEEWPRLISELCRVSARMVIIDYPSAESVNFLAERLFAIKKRVEGDTRPFRVFGRAEIDSAFRAAGFRISRREPQFLWPMALHRAHHSAFIGRMLEAPVRGLGITRALGSPVIAMAERA
ncbi:MAG: class I SAM-dependent methyltransferase [Gemmatimonadota bacterium]